MHGRLELDRRSVRDRGSAARAREIAQRVRGGRSPAARPGLRVEGAERQTGRVLRPAEDGRLTLDVDDEEAVAARAEGPRGRTRSQEEHRETDRCDRPDGRSHAGPSSRRRDIELDPERLLRSLGHVRYGEGERQRLDGKAAQRDGRAGDREPAREVLREVGAKGPSDRCDRRKDVRKQKLDADRGGLLRGLEGSQGEHLPLAALEPQRLAQLVREGEGVQRVIERLDAHDVGLEYEVHGVQRPWGPPFPGHLLPEPRRHRDVRRVDWILRDAVQDDAEPLWSLSVVGGHSRWCLDGEPPPHPRPGAALEDAIRRDVLPGGHRRDSGQDHQGDHRGGPEHRRQPRDNRRHDHEQTQPPEPDGRGYSAALRPVRGHRHAPVVPRDLEAAVRRAAGCVRVHGASTRVYKRWDPPSSCAELDQGTGVQTHVPYRTLALRALDSRDVDVALFGARVRRERRESPGPGGDVAHPGRLLAYRGGLRALGGGLARRIGDGSRGGPPGARIRAPARSSGRAVFLYADRQAAAAAVGGRAPHRVLASLRMVVSRTGAEPELSASMAWSGVPADARSPP